MLKKRTVFWSIVAIMSMALMVWLVIAYNTKKSQYEIIESENSKIKSEISVFQSKIDSLKMAIAIQDEIIRHSISEYDSLKREKERVITKVKEVQSVLSIYPITTAVDTLRYNLLNNKADTVVVISPYNVAVINNVFKQRNQLQSLVKIQEKTLLQSDIIQHQMSKTIQQRDSLIQQNTSIINRCKTLNSNQEQQISLLLKDVEKQKKKKKFYKQTTVIAIIVATIASLKLSNVF